jgi:hypothetical protein
MFDPREIPTFCSQVPSYGVQAITLTVPWNAIEPQKNVFNWAQADKWIEKARACGLTIGVHVLSKSRWATQPSPSTDGQRLPSMPPVDMDDYYNFMFNLATHYKGEISRYSIENEAASPSNWGSTPEAYAELLATAYRAVHDADPEAIVEPDGVSSTGMGFLVAYDMLQRGQDQQAIDFLSSNYANFAPGRQSGNPIRASSVAELQDLKDLFGYRLLDWMSMLVANQEYYDAFQIHFYGPPHQLPTVMDWVDQQLRARGPGKPIEIWELGYGWGGNQAALDLTAQARAVPKLLATAVGEGSPFVVFWRFTDEIEKAGTGVTGLVTADGPRLAATAFQVTAQKLAGATRVERLDLGAGTTGYRFERSTGDVYVVWRDKTGQVALSLEAKALTITDINGGTIAAASQTLDAGPNPIFIESK